MLSLLTSKLKLYSDEFKLKLKDASFLLSFSGGMDSAIMASLIIEIRNDYNFKLGFAHINHNAHKKSGKVETFVSQYSYENNVDYHLYELFFDSQHNFEACAREKRYTILAEIAKNNSYDFILTAHHQDDQLETLYMKKIDGGDWISKIGIRERMGKLRRPFLNIPKDAIKLHVKQNNISWIEDPTNSDMSIRRNKIRHHELPQAFQADSELKELLLRSAKENLIKIKMTALKLKRDQDNAINNRSLNSIWINRIVLQKYNIEELKLFTYSSIASILKIKLNPQSGGLWNEFKKFINESSTGSIFHIGSLTFMINRHEIIAMDNYYMLKTPEIVCLCNNLLWYSGQFKMRNKAKAVLSSSKNNFTVTDSIYNDGLYIRRWKHGDRMISATSQNHVLLSDLYINNKLSKYDKLTQPVVVNANDMIFWIPGLLHGKINYNNKDKVKIINWVQK